MSDITRKQLLPAWAMLLALLTGSFLMGCEAGNEAGSHSAADHKEGSLWTCSMHPEVLLKEPGQCPICSMDLVQVKSPVAPDQGSDSLAERGPVLYWRAPMDPSEIYDQPGKSKMGMDLVPVYRDERSISGPAIQIDPVTVQNMGVRTARIHRGDFSRSIRTVGKIQYNEEKLYSVNSKTSGWVEKLFINFVGEMVADQAPLLEIYSPDLVVTQEEYLLALDTHQKLTQSSLESVRESAESLLASSRKRLEYWDVPVSEIERLHSTREVKRTIQFRSPASGMVVSKNITEGQHIDQSTSLFQIADLSSVWVHASIYDYELPWIREGQDVRMELSYLPGRTFTGKVAYIYPYLREMARDAHVRLVFDNPELELKIGMYANISIQTTAMTDVVAIPTEAVIRSGARNVVFIVREAGRFEPVQVTLGEEGDEGMIRIVSGLEGGEEIVTSAQFLLDSESRLQEAIQKILAER